jgi:hypothetical protein
MFNKKVKNLDILDIALTKFAVVFGVLFLLAIWPAAMNWVKSVNPWYFLFVAIVAAARPLYRFFK